MYAGIMVCGVVWYQLNGHSDTEPEVPSSTKGCCVTGPQSNAAHMAVMSPGRIPSLVGVQFIALLTGANSPTQPLILAPSYPVSGACKDPVL